MKTLTLTAFIAATLLFTSNAYANEGDKPERQTKVEALEALFTDLDGNADGAISSEEASVSAEVSSEFKKADADADGALSKEEFLNHWASEK